MDYFFLNSEITGSFIKSLTDQALSLGLLALISYNLWRKVQKLEDKLDLYQREDRKAIMDVIQENIRDKKELGQIIQNNTNSMNIFNETLRHKGFSIIICFFFIAIMGCAQPKRKIQQAHVEKMVSISNDSLVRLSNKQLSSAIEKKDTLVNFPFVEVGLLLTQQDLKPLLDEDGNKHSRTFTKDSLHTSLVLTVTPDGKLIANCTSDSLQIVIQNLLREREMIVYNQQDYKSSKLLNDQSVSTTDKETITYNLKYYISKAVVVLAIAALIYLIVKLFKFYRSAI